MTRRAYGFCLTVAALSLLTVLLGCNGGGGSSTPKGGSTPATINVSVSDPATCSAPASGPYTSILIAITDVQINASATAGDNDAGWVDLTPALQSSGVPKQVDLLGIRDNRCFLATLGSNSAIDPGTYQQIRIFLAENTVSNANKVVGNKCASDAVSCVILASDQANPRTLQLSSEAITGIKIPSGQIAGGRFTIADGETKDLDINIDSCASIIVDQGNGSYRLKPVLHAGEVATTSVSIDGTLIDSVTNSPITGGKAIIALEQQDAQGIDRVLMETTADPVTGQFDFCPVSPGTYDVVAVAVNGSNVAYAATITTGVQPGNALGKIPLNPVTGTSTAPASITGDVTTADASGNGTAADILLSAIEQVPGGSLTFTVPVASQSATITVTTAKPATCNTSPCPPYTATYTMTPVPPVNPTVGAFTTVAPGTSYTAGSGDAAYVVEGQAFEPMSGGTADCSPTTVSTTAVSVAPGTTATAPTLAFTGCQ